MLRTCFLFLCAISTLAHAQLNPAITSWVINPGGETGYKDADVNMDGIVKYAGVDNDRDVILQSIGGGYPTAVRFEQRP